jgi:Ca2+-transporting ATPase
MKSETPNGSILSWPGMVWAVFFGAIKRYVATDGEQRAASFAYYALFALFPLIILFVTVGSMFLDEATATTAIIDYVGNYVPVGPDGQNVVINTIQGVIKSRRGVSSIAVLGIVWSSLGFFHALVRGVNHAWGTREYPWWKLPIKNIGMIGIVASALLLGIVAPVVAAAVEAFMRRHGLDFEGSIASSFFKGAPLLFPAVVLFYGFSMFYKFAPRRRTLFSEVWIPALAVTILLQLLQHLFVLYARSFAHFNKVYGAFGGVVALLMWIYLSGTIIIFGGCLSAVLSEVRAGLTGGKDAPGDSRSDFPDTV